MQLSPLQSRLAASLAASLLLLLLYLLLASPKFALAAELPLDSHQHSSRDLYQDSYRALEALSGAPESDVQQSSLYTPAFGLFEPSIVGRAAAGAISLQLDQPRAINVASGTTVCFVVEKSVLLGEPGSAVAARQQLKRANTDDGSKRLYLSANTCRQPLSSAGGDGSTPLQLILSVSNTTDGRCPSASNPPKDGQDKAFREGAVTYGVNATGDIYIGVTAPNASALAQGVYNVELAASRRDYFHQYGGGKKAMLLWMDSDSSSALLVTRNLTHKRSDIARIMGQDPPYELFVSNKNWTAMNGMRQSACGLRNSAQIVVDSSSSNRENSPARTMMTLRGPGGFPKQEFYFVALNASTTYTGILVKKPSVGARQTRQEDGGGGGGGGFASGSIVFAATDFDTVSGTNCRVVTDLEFCSEVQYAVPGNDRKFSNNTELARAYDGYARTMYANFEKVMMQIACEADSTSRYSLARGCNDCRAAYKRWLCSVVIPRCEDFDSSNQFALVRNAGQAFPNGTMLPDEVRNRLGQMAYANASRSRFIDGQIEPGPYKEMLPCEDICYEVVQSCPAKIGFVCPRPHMVAFAYSYGRRDSNASTLTCNYPGEARTPISRAAVGSPLPDALVVAAGSLGLAALLVLG